MKIYIDILLITNAAVCLVLIEAVAGVTHTQTKPWRSFCAAAAGSLSSLLIAVDSENFWVRAAVGSAKLTAAAVSVIIAFGFGFHTLRYLFYYAAANALFTGLCFLFWQLSESSILIVRSLTVYFNVSVVWLILAAGAVYLILEAAERLRALHARCEGFRAVYRRGSLIVCMPAVCDSGNRLCDSFTGRPVVVLCSDKLYYKFGLDSPESEELCGFYLIPYNSVGGKGLLHVTSSGSIRLIEPSGRSRELRCSIGVARSYGASQRALFSPLLLD